MSYLNEYCTHHYTSYERGKVVWDESGSLDDVLYWYCKGIVRSRAAKEVGDRGVTLQVRVPGTEPFQHRLGQETGARTRRDVPVMDSQRILPCFPYIGGTFGECTSLSQADTARSR